MRVKSLSRVRLVRTPWTAAYRAHPSMRFSRQEDWSGVPLPSPKGQLIVLKYLHQDSPSKCFHVLYLTWILRLTDYLEDGYSYLHFADEET